MYMQKHTVLWKQNHSQWLESCSVTVIDIIGGIDLEITSKKVGLLKENNGHMLTSRLSLSSTVFY